MEVKVGDDWFRIEVRNYASVNEWDVVSARWTVLEETKYKVCKVTPKGVRLVHEFEFEAGYVPRHARFVSLSSRKKYAHPSLAAAYEGLLARKAAQHRILSAQLNGVEEVQRKASAVLARLNGMDGSTEVLFD